MASPPFEPRKYRLLAGCITFAALVSAGWVAPLHAQAPPPDLRTQAYAGIGFTLNIPKVYTGLGAFRMFSGTGWGVYVDGKYSLSSPADGEHFFPDETPSDAFGRNDQRIRDEDVYRTVNAGVVRAMHPEIAVYLGAGYTQRENFKQFQNIEDGQPGMGDLGGYYWLEDGGESRGGVNVQGGILLQGGRSLFFQLGGELFPLGAQAGVFLALPR